MRDTGRVIGMPGQPTTNERYLYAVCLGMLLIVLGGSFPIQAWGGTIGAGLELIRREASIPHGPGLQALARHFGLDPGKPRAAVRALVLMREGGTAQLEEAGFAIKGHIGHVVSTAVPLDRLESLAGLPDVVYVEGATRYRPVLDRSVPDTRANQLRSRGLFGTFSGITGKGVVVGIIDSGLDWRHPDFRRRDGSTRIKFLWDPSDRSFEESQGTIGSPPPLGGAGTVYTESQINAALKGRGKVSVRDECGHGTHVTGVAAGNGGVSQSAFSAATFIGMAPEADIVAVRVFGPTCEFLDADVDLVQAFQFIDQKAAEMGRPYVINLSLGTQVGAHDGTDLDELAIDSLVGPGKPGKAVAVAAGNDGGNPIHAKGSFGPAGAPNQSVTIKVSQFESAASIFDFWFDGRDTFTAVIEGGGLAPEDISDQVVLNPVNGSKELLFVTSRAPFFTITISGQAVVSGRFDGWIDGDATFSDHVDLTSVVGIPGTARHAVTVGAHVTKNQWTDTLGRTWSLITNSSIGDLAFFSSPGPSRDGRIKPELTAPGRVIGSALSEDTDPGAPGDTSIFPDQRFVLHDGLHAIGQGTSFSAPHVAGAVALLFQKNPRLDADLARGILTSSSRTDFFTGRVPNAKWGFGKLDAASAVKPATPRIVLSTNQPRFTPGETLAVAVAIQAGRDPKVIDFWFGVQVPDGTIFFAGPGLQTFSATPTPVVSSAKVVDVGGQVLSVQIPDSFPLGTYTFFALGVDPGTDPMDRQHWITNLAAVSVTLLSQ
ncbi:MAG: S8 family serine peptidase [candidate division NC10 bacterium]|nr:S8 family serine peptidase [candidate division NC10 bacterium]MDE2322847.1 S8 family serine peptidase [candidate division NC10 bacterium]